MAAAEPDGAHLHRRRRRGHGGDVVRGRAALPPLLPGTGGAPTAASPPGGRGERAAGLSAAFAFAFAQATGLGGTTGAGRGAARIEEMEAVKERVVKVTFNADVHSSLQWNFRPQQSEIYVSGLLPSVPPLTYSQRRLRGFGFCLRRSGRLMSRSRRVLGLGAWALIWKKTQLGPAPELTLQAASPALLGKAGPRHRNRPPVTAIRGFL